MSVLRLQIFGRPVDFVDCGEVADGFRSILRGWDIQVLEYDPAIPAYITFERREYGFHWDAPWIADKNRRTEDPSVTVMDAVCDFHYEFIDWFVDLHPDHFCLHTAGIEFDGRAVIFPCVQKAGKSTLSIQLALRGHRLLGDDVVALSATGREAVSLGLLPRLRLPLPTRVVDDEFVRFVGRHRGLSDDYWQYVDLGEREIAPLWTTLPVSGIVLLERGAEGPPVLEPLKKSAAMKALIDRNFGRMRDPNRIFDSLRDLAFHSDCMVLRFTRPADAARLLEDHFGLGREAA